MRVKADYYIDSEITEKDAQVHVAQCGQLVADLQRLAEASAPQVGSV
ncbi:hypothetical protein [Stutzerimonas stutzeri]|nr:hypothetical protein [Stutzerimonas stutzeri]